MQTQTPDHTRFRNRSDAGKQLAAHLTAFAHDSDVCVLGLPRGGVPVAYEVAVTLQAPLDVILVRKLGVPREPELAMGAIATGGIRVLNSDVVRMLGIPDEVIEHVTRQEQHELTRREHLYRGERQLIDLRGRTVILVDDGLATGATQRAAIIAARRLGASRCIVAVPVALAATCNALRAEGIEVISVLMPHDMYAIGSWYEDFPQTTDAQVRQLLDRAWQAQDLIPH